MPAEGGNFSISYAIQNPADGGNFSATVSESWISDIDISTNGTVSFYVAANEDGKSRTATITLSYSYSIVGSTGTITANVTVTQEFESGDDGDGDNDEGGDGDDGDDNDEGGDGDGDGGDDGDGDEGGDDGGDGGDGDDNDDDDNDDGGDGGDGGDGDDGGDGGDGGDSGDGGDGDDGDDDDDEGGDVGGGGNDDGLTVADVVGTYTASGTVYDNYNIVSYTWTVKILEADASQDKLNIDGLAYHHVGDTYYYASATLSGGDKTIKIPTQMVGWGYNTGNGDEIAWCGYTPCVSYNSSSHSFGWSAAGPDCTLKYDEATETWTSDYGMLFAAFINWNLTSMYDWYDLIVPTFTLKKTSSSTNSIKTTSTPHGGPAPEKNSSHFTPVMTH